MIIISSFCSRLFQSRTILTTAIVVICGVFLISSASAALQQLQVGMAAPDFSLKLLSGETRTYADVRGDKLTVIVVWSTWGRKSEQVLARMQKLYDMYRDKGLAVIAVNADGQKISESDMAQIRATVDRLKITYPMFVDHGLNYFHDIGVIALPTTVVLDRERTITFELPGYPLIGSEEMADFIATAFEGKKPVVAIAKGHQPDKAAIRLFNMGRNTLKSGAMADSAEGWFKKAIEADSKFVLPHVSLGKMYLQRGDKVLAEAQFKEALTKEPTHIIAMCEAAVMMLDDGRLNEGAALLESAFKVDESYTPCFYYSGLAYARKGKLDQALKMFDEAVRLNAMDQNLYIYKGRALEEGKKTAEAAEAYRKALEIALGIQ